MNARYLLDTSAASYAITKKSLAFDHHLAKVPMAEIGVSTVTEAELRYGLATLTGAVDLRCPKIEAQAVLAGDRGGRATMQHERIFIGVR